MSVTAAGDGYDLRPTGAAPDPIASVIDPTSCRRRAAAVGTGTGLTAEFWNNTTFPAHQRSPGSIRPSTTLALQRLARDRDRRPTTSPAAGAGSFEPRLLERYTFTTLPTTPSGSGSTGSCSSTTPHRTDHHRQGQHHPDRRPALRDPLGTDRKRRGGVREAAVVQPQHPTTDSPASQLYPATILNDNAPAISYSTGWSASTARGSVTTRRRALRHHQRRFVPLHLHRHRDRLAHERNSDQGLVDIYLDNVLQATVDTTNPVRLTQQVVYSRRGLPPGSHTLRGQTFRHLHAGRPDRHLRLTSTYREHHARGGPATGPFGRTGPPRAPLGICPAPPKAVARKAYPSWTVRWIGEGR